MIQDQRAHARYGLRTRLAFLSGLYETLFDLGEWRICEALGLEIKLLLLDLNSNRSAEARRARALPSLPTDRDRRRVAADDMPRTNVVHKAGD